MYKITNLRDKKGFFLDINGKGVHVPPNEEIQHKYPPVGEYMGKLKIEKITPRQKVKKEEKTKEDDE